MVIKTDLCDLFGIKYPIVQAAMGGYASCLPDLTAAVSNAGGLGVISHAASPLLSELISPGETKTDPVKEVIEMSISAIHKVLSLTDKPFGINVRTAALQMDAELLLNAILEEVESDSHIAKGLKVLVTSAGSPGCFGLNKRIKKAGLLHFHTVATPHHAMKAEEKGMDGIIASGYEGGGHVNPYTPIHTFVLVPAVAETVDMPVLAAGGMVDGKSLVAALSLGAQGIYMGTRFVASKESEYHNNYKKIISNSSVTDTIVTKGFLGDLRALNNNGVKEIIKLTERDHSEIERLAFEAKKRLIGVNGDMDEGFIPMGQVAGRIHSILSAKDIIEGIMSEAEEVRQKLMSFG